MTGHRRNVAAGSLLRTACRLPPHGGPAGAALFAALCVVGAPVLAETSCAPTMGTLVSVRGNVDLRRAGDTRWVPASLDASLCLGDQIRTRERSRADIFLQRQDGPQQRVSLQSQLDATTVHMDQNTTATITGSGERSNWLLELCRGALHIVTRRPGASGVITPFVNAKVGGTEFFVSHSDARDDLTVFEGSVVVTNEEGIAVPAACEEEPPVLTAQWRSRGVVKLAPNESATVLRGEAPVKELRAKPRDAVQWALYYPPVDDYGAARDPRLNESAALYRRGKLPEAIAALESVPEAIRDARILQYRAGLLLTVGRVDEAQQDIARVLATKPDDTSALALQSIVSVVRNDTREGLALAQRAVGQDPKSVAAQVALSYALQANFRIAEALRTAEHAVVLEPRNALARARLAELQLSVGDLAAAETSAREAVQLNPDIAKTHTVLGFASLTRIDVPSAKSSFARAIKLDPSSPLPRLGLGLARIREGDLSGGRAQIEIAVSLDPESSLLRSYMGKAYFEENRNELAATQFGLAEKFDPNDPTPSFYQAIEEQAANRPVEALGDLQKSVELNDNRAVYRSRLLLDDDAAARGASLARIYRDLGFEELALSEGYKSVDIDPSNSSAHRFLADAYATRPRHEIARVSELLRSQLLQPTNIMPVQPSLAEANLLILEGAGPARASFNEFNPLFSRNQNVVQAAGIGGSNDTFGDEVVLSGIRGPVSYSVGQFHYDTNGFRENGDLKQDIYSVFVQDTLAPATSVQAELRHRETDRGDLLLRFDPANFSTAFRESQKADIARVGFRHAVSPSSEVIGSLMYQSVKTGQQDFVRGEPPDARQASDLSRHGYIAELQHLIRGEQFNVVSGIGYFDDKITESTLVNTTRQITVNTPVPFPPFIIPITTTVPISFTLSAPNSDSTYASVYSYVHLRVRNDVSVTVGLSGDHYKVGQQLDRNQVNPKLGLVWQPSAATSFRLAAFRVMSRTLSFNQTIEPTEVAGFNQFFDDLDGTIAWRYGAAVDSKFSSNLFGGIEYSGRKLKAPLFLQAGEGQARFIDQSERLGRGYLYWAPDRRLALSAQYRFERLKRDREFSDCACNQGIVRVATHHVPVGVELFHPSGVAAGLSASYFNQYGEFSKPATGSDAAGTFLGRDSFWVIDTHVNYRLPARRGLISVGAKNLFNRKFRFQETDFSTPQVIPQRYLFARFTVNF